MVVLVVVRGYIFQRMSWDGRNQSDCDNAIQRLEEGEDNGSCQLERVGRGNGSWWRGMIWCVLSGVVVVVGDRFLFCFG